jgi:hypothetical protein
MTAICIKDRLGERGGGDWTWSVRLVNNDSAEAGKIDDVGTKQNRGSGHE